MARISIDVETNNHKTIKMAAMLHDKSMMDYVKDIVIQKAQEDLSIGISEPNALTKQIMDNTHNNIDIQKADSIAEIFDKADNA